MQPIVPVLWRIGREVRRCHERDPLALGQRLMLEGCEQDIRFRGLRPQPHSICAYLADLCQFAAWFTEHTSEPFTLEAVTEYDVRGWRNRLASTVNRRLAAKRG